MYEYRTYQPPPACRGLGAGAGGNEWVSLPKCKTVLFIVYDECMTKRKRITNSDLLPIVRLNNKSAAVARGFIEHHIETGETALRKCQEAGAAHGKLIGADVSPALCSKVAGQLKKAHVINSRRVSGHFYIEPGENFDEFVEFLESELDYGTRLTGTHDEDMQRFSVLKILEDHGAIRAHAIDSPIPRKGYSKLQELVNAGELEIIFVRKGLVAGVKHKGETHRVPYYSNQEVLDD